MGDPLWHYKVLGLHCDGTNGSTTFTDVKGKTVTANGNAQISTAQYPALTGKTSSAYFDGSGDYLSVPASSDFDFGSGDFSIKFLVFMSVVPGAGQYVCLMDNRDSDGTDMQFTLWYGGTEKWYLNYTTNGTTQISSSGISSHTPAANTWYEIAWVRNGTSLKVYVDGVGSTSHNIGTSTLFNSSSPLNIGRSAANAYYLNGYLSEIEIYKGIALHTANFTPPTTPFADEYVSVSGTVKDSSGNFTSRLVRVYRSDSGEFVGNALSDASTGAYKLIAANSGTTTPLNHFAVCHDNAVTNAANIVLAMPFDPEYASLTTFRDLKGHTFTRNGSATLSATKAKHGVYSFYNGTTTSDYIYTPPSTDFDFTSTTEFTVEFWMNTTLYDVGYTRGVIATFGSVDTAGTGFSIGYYTGNITTHLGVDTLRIDDGLWHHISMSVDSTTTRVFIDGNLRQSGARAANTYNAARNLVIGNFANLDVNHVFVGYIDGLVIWKGVALRTAAFTPPARFLVDASPTENALIFDDITPA